MNKYKCLMLILVALTVSACSPGIQIDITFPESIRSFEYGDSINVYDLVIWGDYDSLEIIEIDSLKLGQQEIQLQARKGKHSEVFKTTIEISDTNFPFFNKTVDTIEILQNETIDLKEYFSASDTVDGILEVTFSLPIDTSAPGTHSREAIAKDNNENVTRHLVSVVVSEIVVSPSVPPVEGNGNHGAQLPPPTVSPPSEAPAVPSDPPTSAPAIQYFPFTSYSNDTETRNACVNALRGTTPIGYEGGCDLYANDKNVNLGYKTYYTKR